MPAEAVPAANTASKTPPPPPNGASGAEKPTSPAPKADTAIAAPTTTQPAKTDTTAAGTTTTAAPAAPATTTEPLPKDSERFALINRQTKELVEAKRRWKLEQRTEAGKLEAARNAWQAEQAERIKSLEAFESGLERAKADPDSFLRGIYGDDWFPLLSEYALGDKKPTAALVAHDMEEKMSKRLEDIEARNQARWKAAEQQRFRQERETEAAAEQSFSQSAIEHVKANAEKYDLITRTKSHWRVPSLIKEHFQKTGEIVSPEVAAATLEKFLEEDLKTVIESPKLKAKPAAAPATQAQPNTTQEPRRSLDNDMVASTPTSFTSGYVTDDEAVKRAFAAYQRNRSVK